MPVCAITHFSDSSFTLPLLIFCAVLMCLSVPAYFHALRPRLGTTEWIRRLDPPQFAPLQIQRLHWADALWTLLATLSAAVLRFLYYFFYLKLHHRSNAPELLSVSMRYILVRVLPCAVLALAVYLLVRTMFGKPLPALLCAVLAGFTQNTASASTALLAVSLLCLYVWMSAPYDAPLFLRALWLVGAGVTYALATLLCLSAVWLLPFYLSAYVLTQVLRWRGGNPARRGKKLLLSLLLTPLALIFGTIALWLLYCTVAKRMAGSPIDLLRSFRFYRALLPTIGEKLTKLVSGNAAVLRTLKDNAFVYLAGLASLPPLVHGAFRLRDGRCLFLLCLLPCCLCAWLLGGTSLLSLPLLLSLSRLWSVCTERNHASYAVGLFCAVTLCFTINMILF